MSLKETVTKARRFPFAGRFMLVRHMDDGPDSTDPVDIYTSGRTVVESIGGTDNLTTEDLPDGNSLDPAATYTTGRETSVAIVVRTDDPEYDKFVDGGTRAVGEPDVLQYYQDQEFTVRDDGKVAICDNAGSAATLSADFPIIVRDCMTEEDYVKVTGDTLESGQYSVDMATGVLTFAEDAKGKAVFVTFAEKVSNATVYGSPAMPKSGTYTLYVSGPSEDYTQVNRMRQTDIYDSVQITGDRAGASRQKAPGQRTLNFRVLSPRAGKQRKRTVLTPEKTFGAGEAVEASAPAPAGG